ncbi:putative E3 ubiquitin-protein ligase DTX3 [Collichthys lucidus]|uniref:E3 ubiquitin-protein ligase n=1 Tax=Collichthys lucidus TaxID=240159 RepID=A0A4U5UR48_COLLU|nr:putative E3 ubiquitin-protein ligase DTX3 [Collichthys lucidus]
MESRPNEHTDVVHSAEDCAICLDKIQGKKTLKCLHSFCSECIDSVFKFKPACPICNTYHGEYTGTQPEGTMTVTQSWLNLPGFEHCGCIVIQYSFPSGIQGPEHPNPGVRYSGTSRTAYLPDCKEGQKVLKLLKKAFDRRLIFTIGRSVTTGLNNVITWNDIHHKTNIDGGPQRVSLAVGRTLAHCLPACLLILSSSGARATQSQTYLSIWGQGTLLFVSLHYNEDELHQT